MHAKIRQNPISFPYAIRSFIGYLEGTGKSVLTIKNYRLDICSFQDFISKENEGKAVLLGQVDPDILKRYQTFLKEKGLKTNTRRRKILTVTLFLSYLARRKKVAPEMARKVPTPHKIERIPFTVSAPRLVEAIRGLRVETVLDARNRALLWTLAETGCLVSEITHLCFDHWTYDAVTGGYVRIGTKTSRLVPVSRDLYLEIQGLKGQSKGSACIFQGFNRFGSLGSPITARGVELLVKHYGPKLGFEELTPRTFRHSVILHWFQEGIPQLEIQTRLGLKTTYAFRSYEPLIKSNSETTSIS